MVWPDAMVRPPVETGAPPPPPVGRREGEQSPSTFPRLSLMTASVNRPVWRSGCVVVLTRMR